MAHTQQCVWLATRIVVSTKIQHRLDNNKMCAFSHAAWYVGSIRSCVVPRCPYLLLGNISQRSAYCYDCDAR